MDQGDSETRSRGQRKRDRKREALRQWMEGPVAWMHRQALAFEAAKAAEDRKE